MCGPPLCCSLQHGTTNTNQLPPLRLFPALRELRVIGQGLTQAPPLAGCPALARLWLPENRLRSLAGLLPPPLAPARGDSSSSDSGSADAAAAAGEGGAVAAVGGALRELYVYSNRLESIAGVERLTALEVLSVADNRLPRLAGAGALPSLHTLDAAANDLAAPSADLRGCTRLRSLNLAANPIQRLSELRALAEALPALEDLRLRDPMWGACPLALAPNYHLAALAALPPGVTALDTLPIAPAARAAAAAAAGARRLFYSLKARRLRRAAGGLEARAAAGLALLHARLDGMALEPLRRAAALLAQAAADCGASGGPSSGGANEEAVKALLPRVSAAVDAARARRRAAGDALTAARSAASAALEAAARRVELEFEDAGGGGGGSEGGTLGECVEQGGNGSGSDSSECSGWFGGGLFVADPADVAAAEAELSADAAEAGDEPLPHGVAALLLPWAALAVTQQRAGAVTLAPALEAEEAEWRGLAAQADASVAAVAGSDSSKETAPAARLLGRMRAAVAAAGAPLARLSLAGCGLRDADLAPLAALTGLRVLVVAANALSGLAPLAPLGGSLTALDASCNAIDAAGVAAAGALAFQRLERLDLGFNRLAPADAAAAALAAACPALVELRLEGSPAASDPALGPLLAARGATMLARLDGRPVVEAGAEAAGDGLREDMAGLGLVELPPLPPLSLPASSAAMALERLDLSRNHLSDAAPLAALTRLRRLDVSNNRLASLSPLTTLSRLEVLAADGNRLTAFGGVGGLRALTELRLGRNAAAGARGETRRLARLPLLAVLELAGNPLVDSLGPDYRPALVFALRPLRALDGRPVSAAERAAARARHAGRLTLELLEEHLPASSGGSGGDGTGLANGAAEGEGTTGPAENAAEPGPRRHPLAGLRSLDLSALAIRDTGGVFAPGAAAAPFASTLQELSLRGNQLGPGTLVALAGLAALTALDLSGNRLGGGGGGGGGDTGLPLAPQQQQAEPSTNASLLPAPPPPPACLSALRTLNLSGNGLAALAPLALAARCPLLRRLDASGNDLARLDGLGGCRKLRELLVSRNARLRSLELTADGGCGASTAAAAAAASGGGGALTRLRELVADECGLRSLAGLPRLAPGLTLLRARGNRLADAAADAERAGVLHALREVALEGCPAARRPAYRALLVQRAPQLRRIDGRRVTEEERAHAQLLLASPAALAAAAAAGVPGAALGGAGGCGALGWQLAQTGDAMLGLAAAAAADCDAVCTVGAGAAAAHWHAQAGSLCAVGTSPLHQQQHQQQQAPAGSTPTIQACARVMAGAGALSLAGTAIAGGARPSSAGRAGGVAGGGRGGKAGGLAVGGGGGIGQQPRYNRT